MLELWEIDINEYYYVDNEDKIWSSEEQFCEYHFNEYHGTKDNYEQWCVELMTEYDLRKELGYNILKKYITEMQETIDMYRGECNE